MYGKDYEENTIYLYYTAILPEYTNKKLAPYYGLNGLQNLKKSGCKYAYGRTSNSILRHINI